MNSLLYFLEPHVELNDPLFRYATLRSHILPEIEGLKSYKPELDVKIILSEHLAREAIVNELELFGAELCVVSEESLSRVFKDYKEASSAWYTNRFSQKQLLATVRYLKKVLGSFVPDVTITYESSAPFLKEAFPDSLHLNSMFGAFSRAPFPAFGLIDPCGLYKESFQSIFSERIHKFEIEAEEKEVLREFRSMVSESLASKHPVNDFLETVREQFDQVVILACQISGYFAYDECCQYKSQLDMIENVLQNTPKNIGVIVTEHGYSRQVSDSQVRQLKNKYRNFIYFEDTAIPFVTQFLLPYCDGCLTVSSSVAYQATLWQKPLLCLGNSQMNLLSTADSFDEFWQQVFAGLQIDFDNVLYYLLSHLHVSHKFVLFNGEKYFRFLFELDQRYKKYGESFELFPKQYEPKELLEVLKDSHRGWLLNKEISKSGVKTTVDNLRLGFAQNQAVSFDLFDTLVERDFAEPHELFLFIEPKVQALLKNKNFKFHYFRRQAEADTRRPTKGDFEVTLEEIYRQFQQLTGISDSDITQIIEIEQQAEIDLVKPKRFMKREYQFSSLLCKTRTIITDIYLNQDVIETILNEVGLVDYDLLLVSAETKTRKHNGSLYPQYINWISSEHSIEAGDALHVGDNKIADGSMAARHGINTFVLPKAIDNYRDSKISRVFSASFGVKGLSTSILHGIFSNKFYSGHLGRVHSDSVFNAQPYKYGYVSLGPLVLGFVQWLHRRAKTQGITDLYFLARDGWLLKEVYDKYFAESDNGIKSHYLYCSRRAVMVPALESLEDVFELASQSFSARPLKDFLSSRFGLLVDDIPRKIWKKHGYKAIDIVSPYHDQKRLFEFLRDISPLILDNAASERDNYMDYLQDIGLLDAVISSKPAVVDIGYSGSMQYYLKKMTKSDSLAGFYFLTHHHSREMFDGEIFEGYLENFDDHKIAYRHALNDHVFVFESALSSQEGSLINIKGKGENRKLILLDAEEEQRRRHLVEAMHSGALKFVDDIVDRFSHYKHDFEFSPLLASKMILNFSEYPSGIDASMFADFEVENTFGGGSVWLIPEPPNSAYSKGKLKPEVVEKMLADAKWKKGAKAYYSWLNKEGESIKDNALMVKPEQRKKGLIPENGRRSKIARKRSKLRRDPYGFFEDSKVPALSNFKHAFNPRTPFGRYMSRTVRRIV